MHGEPEAWVNRGATELIYGLRRHRGEGMVVTNIPDIITNRGGIIARGKYGSVDLSQYNGHIGQRWGDRDGPPRDLIVESQRYQIREAALVKTTSEARDAIWSGYGLITGAQASFSEHRDSYGFGKLNGRNWAHSQSIAAVSTAYTLAGDNWRDYGRQKSSPCYLMINSWGSWNDGPKGVFDDIPDGSYWITEDEMQFLLDQEQVIAVGNFDGFPRPPIETYGFDFLTNLQPLAVKIDAKYFGLVEIANAIKSAVDSDLTRPYGVDIPAPELPDPYRPRPPPEPDHKWLDLKEAIAAHKSDPSTPILFLIGADSCQWCEKQRSEIDKINTPVITTYVDIKIARKIFSDGQIIKKVPAIKVWRNQNSVVNHVGFISAAALESMLNEFLKANHKNILGE